MYNKSAEQFKALRSEINRIKMGLVVKHGPNVVKYWS